MALPQSKVTAQGQISVPAEIRRKLGIGPGSVLEWEEEGEQVVIRRSDGTPPKTFTVRFSRSRQHRKLWMS